MKKILSLKLLLYCCIPQLFADGINFLQGKNFQQVLEIANTQKKLIFINCYLDWSNPCILFNRNVLPDKELGEYFNSNFINLKVDLDNDADKVYIANKYNIHAYPTLLWIDSDGKMLLKSEGNISSSSLLELAKKIINQKIVVGSKITSHETNSFPQKTSSDCLCDDCLNEVTSYDGCVCGNCANGNGTYVYKNFGVYIGDFNNNKRSGKGKFTWKSGEIYEGEWKNDFWEGNGKMSWPDGRSYIGQFIESKKNGIGTMVWPESNKYTGETYKGEWKNDTKNGQGEHTWKSGQKYIGGFKDGVYDGNGTMVTSKGDKYVGEWKNGKRNGYGTQTYSNGKKYVGEFIDDNYAGKGTLYTSDGKTFTSTDENLSVAQKKIIEDYKYLNRQELSAKQINDETLSKYMNTSTLSQEEISIYARINTYISECKGEIITQGNIKFTDASFTEKGIVTLEDYYGTCTRYIWYHIPWGHMQFITHKKNTFQYSLITVSFIDGFFCNKNTSNYCKELGGEERQTRCVYFPVKNERVKECIELIYQLNEINKKKQVSQSSNLTKEEEWKNGYLHIGFKDSKGLLQGKYQVFNGSGKLIAFGNYKDNGRVGMWQDDDVKGEYANNHRVGTWVYSNGKTSIYDKHGFWIGGTFEGQRFVPSNALCN
jgi:hypothetical protein